MRLHLLLIVVDGRGLTHHYLVLALYHRTVCIEAQNKSLQFVLYPSLALAVARLIHEGSWVFLASLEAEGEAVLARWDKAPSEVVQHISEAGNDATALTPDNLDDLFAPSHIVILHRLILNNILGVGAVHVHAVVLALDISTLCHMRWF